MLVLYVPNLQTLCPLSLKAYRHLNKLNTSSVKYVSKISVPLFVFK